jgi:hypothetical protein
MGYTGYAQDMHGIHMGYTWDTHRICMGYTQDMHGIHTGYAGDISKVPKQAKLRVSGNLQKPHHQHLDRVFMDL